ncbi:MAG: alkaline phosphatase family protein [Anaerolineales bacterium]
MNLYRLVRGKRRTKVFVIGLDCAAPELVFDRWRQDLPNLSRLAGQGLWGELESCIPAITVPAWSSMLSGRDPGELGIYGFRNRADYSYDRRFIATSNYVEVPLIWDYLTAADKRSVVIGLPQTYPVKPLKGEMVAGFLAPGRQSEFTYPSSLKNEVLRVAPEYDVDVPQFRTDDKGGLLRQIQEMTEKRFRVVDYLLQNKAWDFFMLMEIGVDRIHHGFWSYHDPQHRRYVAGNPFEHAIHDYYVYVDRAIGEWLSRIDEDTVVLVVSDHGAKRMDGGICLNEWLWREGWLAFKQEPAPGEREPLDRLEIDWSRTRAWGDGGYYGRVFLNVQGREPEGVVPAESYEAVRDELADRLRAIPDPEGRSLGTRVFKPQEVYRSVKGAAPDLMVYFGDLLWRSVGSLGYGDIYTYENDTGPDDCNHAQNGMFILHDPAQKGNGARVTGAQLMDVTPTLLELFGIAVPSAVQGVSLFRRPRTAAADAVREREPSVEIRPSH